MLETTSDFITTEVSNGWVTQKGLKAVTNKKTTIDPKTDEEIEPTTAIGINVKGVTRTYTFAVVNVSEVVAYVINSSSTNYRNFVLKATPEEGDVIEGKLALGGAECGKLSISLSPSTKYKISVESYEGESGGDMVLYALKLNITQSLTTAASTFSTYAASYPVNYKDLGLTAYGIGLDETAKKVTYTEINGIVPANTPVLVKGEASKTYSLTKAEGDVATVSTDLKVSDGTIEGDGSTVYAFGTKDGVSGFKIVRAGVKIPAKKGYLQLSSSSTGAKDFFAFGGETTSINNISANGINEEETPLFNLAGQRVNKSYKGVVVKNGKKFVNK